MKPTDRVEQHFPTGLLAATVCAVCLGLALSSIFTFSTLLRLRTQYLENRSHEIALAIEAQARGMGRRNNLQFWQTLIEDSYPTYSDTAAFVALVDQSGGVLAGMGAPSLTHRDFAGSAGKGIYIFDLPLAATRMPRSGLNQQVQGWRLRVGLHTSAADFIRRQAWIHLSVSGVAAVVLLTLALFLLRMLERFLELKTREGAERHLRALGTMAASLAHEIRNPLGAMKGLTQLAQEELPPDHTAQASMRTVVSEAERLERLVSDLLDFARPKEPQNGEFDFAALVSDIQSLLQQRLDNAGITLKVSVAPVEKRIRSDAGGLRQVLLNVLYNALDATPRGGVVTLCAGLKEHGRIFEVEIEDSGHGLGDRNPEELFQPFVTTKVRGTGLGLAVSRQIVESLGGSLNLANRPQGGACCVIRLPLQSGQGQTGAGS